MLVRPQGSSPSRRCATRRARSSCSRASAVTASFDALHASCASATGSAPPARSSEPRRGELSVKVASFVVLAETERGFGDKWHGITDPDLRYRHREADLWANPETRTVLDRRHALLRSIREQLWRREFVEVETPILNAVAVGRDREAVLHALQLPRRRHVPAHRARAVAEAPRRRRLRAGLRDRQALPQRGHLAVAQPRSSRPSSSTPRTGLRGHDVAHRSSSWRRASRDVLGTTSLTYQGRPLDMAVPWRRASMAELVSERSARRSRCARPSTCCAATWRRAASPCRRRAGARVGCSSRSSARPSSATCGRRRSCSTTPSRSPRSRGGTDSTTS